MNRLEKLCLMLLIFLIPSNMAIHWFSPAFYLNGHLVDYFIPKLYLSDFPAIILILIFVTKLISKRPTKAILYILIVPIYLLVRSFFTPIPQAAIWYSLKVFECILLIAYLIQLGRNNILKSLRMPLILGMGLEIGLCLYQYIKQISLFGYLFLGEPNLKSVGLATVNWFGKLEVAPYGTTAHPNILAGYLTVSILLLCLSIHISPIKNTKKTAIISIISLSVYIIILTQSFSALVSLIMCFLIYKITYIFSNNHTRLIFLMCTAGSLILSPLFLKLTYQSKLFSDNKSFSIRYELNQVALSLFKKNPLIGVGPNQFIYYLPKQPISGQKTLFLQPPHNILALVTVETGLIGLILLTGTIFYVYRAHKLTQTPSTLLTVLPLIALILIGAVDHYPATLQTGQLLLVLATGILLSKS